MSEREEVSDEGEPLRTVEVTASPQGEGGLKHTIPALARELMDVENSDELEVDIYQNGYVVRKA